MKNKAVAGDMHEISNLFEDVISGVGDDGILLLC